jgi:hypothetical protein
VAGNGRLRMKEVNDDKMKVRYARECVRSNLVVVGGLFRRAERRTR